MANVTEHIHIPKPTPRLVTRQANPFSAKGWTSDQIPESLPFTLLDGWVSAVQTSHMER